MEIIDMSTKRKLKKMVSVLFILGCFFIGNTKCKGADLEYISQETGIMLYKKEDMICQ